MNDTKIRENIQNIIECFTRIQTTLWINKYLPQFVENICMYRESIQYFIKGMWKLMSIQSSLCNDCVPISSTFLFRSTRTNRCVRHNYSCDKTAHHLTLRGGFSISLNLWNHEVMSNNNEIMSEYESMKIPALNKSIDDLSILTWI